MASRGKKKTPKPKGYSAFDKLTRQLVGVPKSELDKEVKTYQIQKKTTRKSR